MPQSRTQIRKAVSSDIDLIIDIADSGSVSWGIESIKTSLEKPNSIFVAENNEGSITGFIAVLVVSDELQILNIVVSPEFRNKGIATLLIRSAAIHAATIGAQNCFLEVDAANQPALSLYEKLGFKETGRRPKYYSNGNDAIMMLATIENILDSTLRHSE